jgi:hypothetical protein
MPWDSGSVLRQIECMIQPADQLVFLLWMSRAKDPKFKHESFEQSGHKALQDLSDLANNGKLAREELLKYKDQGELALKLIDRLGIPPSSLFDAKRWIYQGRFDEALAAKEEAYIAAALKADAMTINEARFSAGMPPLPTENLKKYSPFTTPFSGGVYTTFVNAIITGIGAPGSEPKREIDLRIKSAQPDKKLRRKFRFE